MVRKISKSGLVQSCAAFVDFLTGTKKYLKLVRVLQQIHPINSCFIMIIQKSLKIKTWIYSILSSTVN